MDETEDNGERDPRSTFDRDAKGIPDTHPNHAPETCQIEAALSVYTQTLTQELHALRDPLEAAGSEVRNLVGNVTSLLQFTASCIEATREETRIIAAELRSAAEQALSPPEKGQDAFEAMREASRQLLEASKKQLEATTLKVDHSKSLKDAVSKLEKAAKRIETASASLADSSGKIHKKTDELTRLAKSSKFNAVQVRTRPLIFLLLTLAVWWYWPPDFMARFRRVPSWVPTPPLEQQALVKALAHASQGGHLAVVLGNGDLKVWNTTTGVLVETVQVARSSAVAISNDGTRIAAGSENTIRLHQVPRGNPIILRGHWDIPRALAFSPDGKRLLSAAKDKRAYLWDLEPLRRRVVGEPGSIIISVAFSHDGSLVSLGSEDHGLRVYDASKLAPVEGFSPSPGAVHSLSFSADMRFLASGYADGTIRLWTLPAGKLERTWRSHEGPVHQLAFAPEGVLLASGGGDGGVHIWDSASGSRTQTLGTYKGPITGLAFILGGNSLVCASGEETAIRLWKLE